MAEQNTRRHGPRGPHGGMAPGEKAKDFKGTMKKLMTYIGKYKFAVATVIVFAIGSTIFSIIGPKILSKATTELFNGLVAKIKGTGGIDFDKIGKILLILLTMYLVSAVFSFFQGWIMTGVTQKLCFRFRKEISEKIDRMPMKYFESRTVGEVLSRITNDVDTLGQSLNQSVTILITSVTTIIGVLIMMLTISPLMTLIAFIILPVSAFLISLVIKHSQKYFFTQQEYLGKINGQVEEVFSGQNVIKVFNREEVVKKTFEEDNDVLYQSAWKSQFFSGMMQPIMMFVGNLGYVAVAISGSMLAIKGTIEVGDIQAFIQYVRSFTQPITQVAQVSNMLQSMAAATERVFEFLEEEEEDQFAENPVHDENLQGSVTFEHVKFGYDEDKIIIHDFNSQISPGQTVAIVGPTGAGKTTMVKLLMRFYDVNEGAIKVDGYDIRDFNRSELRENFGMVLQDTWLFKGTIMENIRYGRLDAADEEVIAAAKTANADAFIRRLQNGYDTVLEGDGANLSQGQRQLLNIARAALSKAPVLVMDEATSSVDTITERQIQEGMDALMKDRTTFVIAHRLSTIRNSDMIMVLEHGRIIERGTHTELLQRQGRYYELYTGKAELD